MNPILSVEQLGLRLSGTVILDAVSFAVEPGEYVSVVGPNGAGKTSLIKCLCGIYPPRAGSIRLMNRDAATILPRERARMLSYVPQAEGRVFPFTAEEFVLLSRYPHLSPFTTVTPADRAAADTALQQTGTQKFRHRKLGTLSGGERQMVFIAAALAQEAPILLLDEPASFLDYRHQSEVAQLLIRLNREAGRTILTVSHNLNTAARSSSRILALKQGKPVFYGPPEQLLELAQLRTVFDTEFRLVHDAENPLPLVIPAEETPPPTP